MPVTSKIKDTTFIYHGDFSGVVSIANETGSVLVSAQEFVDLVAKAYVLPRKITRLEQTNDSDEILF